MAQIQTSRAFSNKTQIIQVITTNIFKYVKEFSIPNFLAGVEATATELRNP